MCLRFQSNTIFQKNKINDYNGVMHLDIDRVSFTICVKFFVLYTILFVHLLICL